MTILTMIRKTILRSRALIILVLLLETALFSRTAVAEDFTTTSLGDYGNVTVMEVSGNYDAYNSDGSVNAVPRQIIAQEFFKTHKDDYDFIVIFSNFDFAMPDNGEARGFYSTVKNDTSGIGLDPFDHTALYGSIGKLQGTVDMGNLATIVSDPLDPMFEDTLGVLSHEMMHRWAANAKFKDTNGTISSALLGKDGSHWSFLLDSGGSLMYGNAWQDNGNGTFTSTTPQSELKFYSPLDLYLMGMIDKSRVPPMLLIDSPGIDAAQLPQAGVTITGTARTVTIDDIVAAMGPRTPDAVSSQKSFKTAFIYVTQPGTFVSDDLYKIENVRNSEVTRFSILSDGNAIMQVASTPKDDVPVNPGITPPSTSPRATPPNLDEAVQWLMAAQLADGSWQDLAQTTERDTAAAMPALKNFSTAQQNYQAGLLWLGTATSGNLDYLSRRIGVFAGAGQDTNSLVQDLLARRNTDGGWGSGEHYASSNADTALALNALAVAGYGDSSVPSKAIEYLKSKQNTDGGWGGEDKGGMVQETAHVLSAFNQYGTAYQLDDAIARGTTWLIGRQNSDGGFGNSPSTVYDTAVATMALWELNVSTSITNKALEYIKGQQSENGSWNNSAYQTALAVNAIYKATVDPDLAVTSDDITIIPATITSLPANIVINANINNLGQTSATAKVVLYKGSIADQNKLGEQTLSFPGLASTSVTFSAMAQDGSEHRFYIVVDPDNVIKESNELNNTAVKILSPEATYDFEILSSDVTVSPNTADMSQDVEVTAKITNKGTMTAYNVQVKYYIEDTVVPFNIGTQTVDIPAGATITNEITWRANKAGVNMPLTAQVDPFNNFAELSETNNQAFVPITVNADIRPNLTISYKDIIITPNPANSNGNMNISALVRNEGSFAAADINVSFYSGVPGADGLLLGTRIIQSLVAGQSAPVALDWTNLQESGEKIIYIQVDPANQITEIREDDNDAFTTVNILTLPDLALASGSIAFSPAAPKEGDPVTITVTVQNKGEQSASNVVVRLSDGSDVLGSQTIPSLTANGTATVSLAFDTVAKKGAYTITAVVDPDNAITEQSKDNNSSSRTLGVQDSSLWVTEQYISPNGDGVKDSTQLFFSFDTPRTITISVVNNKGETVRTFDGPELAATAAGAITWDGTGDHGTVVDDGVYQMQLRDAAVVIGSLGVTVDTNRSPLSDAIGTNYFLNNNLTFALPYIWTEDWVWLKNDSGILFTIRATNQNSPEYPAGLYTMGPNGDDIVRIIPADWTEVNPSYFYSGFRQSPSQDTSKVAITLWKRDKKTNTPTAELWTVDSDGRNLVRIEQSNDDFSIEDMKWSPDNSYLAYIIYRYTGTGSFELWTININTREKKKVDAAAYCSTLSWSPDGTEIAYIAGVKSSSSLSYELRKADRAGNTAAIDTSGEPEISFNYNSNLSWFGSQKMLLSYSDGRVLWLVDMSGNRNHALISNNDGWAATVTPIALSPDNKSIVFDEYNNGETTLSLKIADSSGNLSLLYEADASFEHCGECDPTRLSNAVWSHDGKKIAFVDRAYTKLDACLYEPALYVIDMETKKETISKMADASCRRTDGCSYDDYYACLDKGQSVRIEKVDTWMADNMHVLLEDQQWYGDGLRSHFLAHSETGERKGSLPFAVDSYSIWNVEASPLGTYVTYGYEDIWAMGSLLNLTADLRNSKGKSAIILKGIAADLNFESYQLDYADSKYPDIWSFIQPPSSVPVINDAITTWVPPYEGTFYVRLTVWDKAGNTAVNRKSISWGQYSSITSLYKSLEIFSPNGDGVKDAVELHYRVLDPVHLEFNIYDDADNLVKTYYKDYAAPTEDSVQWDGTDQSLNTVSDGKYTIKVFDYEFFVEVDNTPPDIGINLGGITQGIFNGDTSYYRNLQGHAVDKNIKSWVVEYGEGNNPQEWTELIKGGSQLVGIDNNGSPILNPIQDVSITEVDATWATNTSLKLTVEDYAGNKRSVTTGTIPEEILIYQWEDVDAGSQLDIVACGDTVDIFYNLFKGTDIVETIKNEIVNLTIQHEQDGVWYDDEVYSYPLPEYKYLLSNSQIDFNKPYLIRVKATDILGAEYYSNSTTLDLKGMTQGEKTTHECPVMLRLDVAYDEAACNSPSKNATLSSEYRVNGIVMLQFDSLNYYIQKPEGLQLLRRYDLRNEKWGDSKIDTADMPEGAYPVKVVLNYSYPEHSTMVREVSADSTLTVDRVLPASQITYPTKSSILCPVKNTDAKGDWYGLPIEGIATDNNSVQYYELYYGVGENPAVWQPAMTKINGKSEAIKGTRTVQGQLGVWDVTDLREIAYSLKLKVVDVAGNVSCYTTSFSIDTLTDIVSLSTDKKLISPINSDAAWNAVTANFQIEEYAVVDAKVFNLVTMSSGYTLGTVPVRTIESGRQHPGGTDSVVWDGKTDSGGVVSPDGKYGVVVYATDSCGNTAQKWVAVEVDTAPPSLAITYPVAESTVGSLIVEVKGTADDPNFQSYSLERGQEDVNPDEWLPVSSGTLLVKDSILGKWNTSGLTGRWTLRLTAADSVGNKSAIKVPVTLVAPAPLIKNYEVTPGLISPNNNGTLETTDITYELSEAADIKIEVADSSNTVKHLYADSKPSAGTYTYNYGGQSDSGGVVPDGVYTVSLIATSSTSSQREAITLTVDTTLPTVDMTSPKDNSFLTVADLAVIGTVSDSNMVEYSVSYAGAAGSALIDQGSQSRTGYTFGSLNAISEGDYTLTVRAKDLGENEINKTTVFTIDRTPPVVKLDTPKEGEYYGGASATLSSQPSASIAITGSLVELNLETFSLRYGLGDAPAQWTDLVTGTTVTAYPSSSVWSAGSGSVNDGVYTLSLYAKDKAGLSGEQKVKVTIDNTVPTSAITSLHDGDYVKQAVEVKGTAYDLNFDKYVVEISEGQCSSAFKWTVIKTGTTAVQDNVLTTWQALPPDGDYCMRVTTTDKVGLTSEATVNVKVDTHPPAAPVLSGKVDNKINALLDCTGNTDPDLAGYNVYRNGVIVNEELLAGCELRDQNLSEGEYAYTVKAVDLAGNESSASNEVQLKIDMTGPEARIKSPQDSGTVSGPIDIKGTAYSDDDFKQYRVSIGLGTEPLSWNSIRTSPLSTSYGVLAQWDTFALGEGQVYSIKLEAEDISGNITTHQISVVVDNAPPVAPLLLLVDAIASDVTITWQANTETDLAGYLIYRNDQLANVTGIVVGNLEPYLISASTTTYLDKSLPDGMYTYYLTAMDKAGNISDQSNTLEVTIDTHPPHAAIVDPADTSNIGGKIMVKAEAPDLDIASVQFQYQGIQSSPTIITDWLNLGSPITSATLAAYMDPSVLGLVHGDYRLRAVATDKGSKTDPDPEFITITYADLTAPVTPIGVNALVSGNTVTLSWTPNSESDFAGYNIYMDGQKINTALVLGAELREENLADGTYSYTVTAVDMHQNESKKSSSASARVYAPVIGQPYTPTGQSAIQLQGNNAAANAAVEIIVEGVAGYELQVSTQADTDGKFMADAVLNTGLNTIVSRATDSAGNVSRTSESVVVVNNDSPGAPTGLASSVQDSSVHLTWNANPETDLFGFNVYRDGVKVNLSDSVVVSQATVTASSSYDLQLNDADKAIDSSLSSYWIPQDGTSADYPAWWELGLAAPAFISHLELHWGSDLDTSGAEALYAGKDFEVQVWSADANAWITQTKVAGNAVKDNIFDFKPAYRTDKIRIYITDSTDVNGAKQVRLAEVNILKENVIQTAPPSYDDLNLPNKQYDYTVTAVDNYGFEGPASVPVSATVGVALLSTPTLTATGLNSNITLTWTASLETETAGYAIYKNTSLGLTKIGTVLVSDTTFVDANLINGTYTYRVTASDAVGNESPLSEPATATVAVAPPTERASLTISPTSKGALNATWTYTGATPAGFNLYRGLTTGGPYAKVANALISGASYLDTGVVFRINPA